MSYKVYILWVLFTGGGQPAISSGEYTSLEKCEAAKVELQKMSKYYFDSAICTEK